MKIPKLPFNLHGIIESLGGAFSFSRREIIIISTGIVSVLLIAIVITVVVTMPEGASKTTKSAIEDAAFPRQIAPVSERPFLSDFIIYKDKIRESFTGPVYSREPQDSWTAGMVEEYWIDPKTVAGDQLELDVEKIIRDIFADVP